MLPLKPLLIASLAALWGPSPLFAARLDAPAPSFSLKNQNNQTRTLQDYRGRVVVINFWASWCAPCQVELPELARLAAAYKRQGVRVVAINVDQERARATAVLKKLGLVGSSLEILWDTHSRVVSRYNVPTMPSSYILDKRGIVRYIHDGFRPDDPAAWRREINQLLKK